MNIATKNKTSSNNSRPKWLEISLLLILQCTLLIGQLFLIRIPSYGSEHTTVIHLYHQYALDFFTNRIPYIDFKMEYPPFALVTFSLPLLFSLQKPIEYEVYRTLFVIETTTINLVINLILLLILSIWKPKHSLHLRAIVLYTLGVFIFSPILPWLFDIFPALLTILAFIYHIYKKPLMIGFSLGLAITTKLYPLVVLPVFISYYLTGKEFRSFGRMVLGLILATIFLIPLFLINPEWPRMFLSYHLLRGINIDSLPGGIFLLFKALNLIPVQIVHNFGSFNIEESYSTLVIKWLTPFSLGILGILIVLNIIRFKDERDKYGSISNQSLVAYTVIMLLAFILTNKVFSPQYLIWLLPFIPLLRFRHSMLFLIIGAISIILYPYIYALLIAAEPISVILLNLRNILTVVWFIWLLAETFPPGRIGKRVDEAHASKTHPILQCNKEMKSMPGNLEEPLQ